MVSFSAAITNMFLPSSICRRDVKRFVRKSESCDFPSCLVTLFELDDKLQRFYRSLPNEYKDRNLMDSCRGEPIQRNSFFIHSVYYVCLTFLHSSVVPALSTATLRQLIPPMVVKMSSKTATSNARLFAKMARAYLATTPDIARVPSFVGYCAFVAGMALSAVLNYVGLEKGQAIRRNCAICTLLVWELKVYWPVLQCFVRTHVPFISLYCPRHHTYLYYLNILNTAKLITVGGSRSPFSFIRLCPFVAAAQSAGIRDVTCSTPNNSHSYRRSESCSFR
jgi:hypothetical protein